MRKTTLNCVVTSAHWCENSPSYYLNWVGDHQSSVNCKARRS
ncbi:rCG25319 [Rattus norvegicus]|uniref:RCG25319 n=1 Tax=Rattus norvegicus TaxID=10116 RepID=A6I1S7_RAT|nr:rCG25319 [Rattus norvegicus]